MLPRLTLCDEKQTKTIKLKNLDKQPLLGCEKNAWVITGGLAPSRYHLVAERREPSGESKVIGAAVTPPNPYFRSLPRVVPRSIRRS
jgi:hypothetical protein